MIKICTLSDIHGQLCNVPACDLLLIAGDLCPVRDHSLSFQEHWLEFNFKPWLKNIDAKEKVFIFGNHDFIGEERPERVSKIFSDVKNIHYLQDSGVECLGLKVYGSAWTLYFYDWAFNLYENDLKDKWAQIPQDTDILVCHGPPYGYGDLCGKENVGSPSLLERIKEIKPKLVVYGHIHNGFGTWTLDKTILANVSVVDDRYELVRKPVVFTV